MVPVVDGLEAKHHDQVEFRRIDANSAAGKSAYQAYALRGHPGFVLLSPNGSTLWKGIGEQTVETVQSFFPAHVRVLPGCTLTVASAALGSAHLAGQTDP